MGKFDGVLIATDFDDTYCGPGGVVHPANIEAVKAFTAQGGFFTVATGRANGVLTNLVPLRLESSESASEGEL